MKKQSIYIASSWRNQHAVQLLTSKFRGLGYEVISWIENNYDENPNSSNAEKHQRFDFEEWVKSEKADQSFKFDTNGAMHCDLFIYVGQAGKDAAAECGMCYGSGRNIPMLGLWSKGEDFGLMRKMFDHWSTTTDELLIAAIEYMPNPHGCYANREKPHVMHFDTQGEYELRLSAWERYEEKRRDRLQQI